MFNKQKWKGGGSLLLLFIQCSATEGLLASGREKLFQHIHSSLFGEKWWEMEVCKLLACATDLGKVHPPLLQSCPICSGFKLVGTGTVLPRSESSLQQEVCRSCNSAEPSETSPHPPLPLC